MIIRFIIISEKFTVYIYCLCLQNIYSFDHTKKCTKFTLLLQLSNNFNYYNALCIVGTQSWASPFKFFCILKHGSHNFNLNNPKIFDKVQK